MPLCPECRGGRVEFDAPACGSCGWAGTALDGGILDLLSRGATASRRCSRPTASSTTGSPATTSTRRSRATNCSASRPSDCSRRSGRWPGGRVRRRRRPRPPVRAPAARERPRLLVGVDLAEATCAASASDRPDVRLVRANAESLPVPRGARRRSSRPTCSSTCSTPPTSSRAPSTPSCRAAGCCEGALPREHLAVPANRWLPVRDGPPAHVRPPAAAQGARATAGLRAGARELLRLLRGSLAAAPASASRRPDWRWVSFSSAATGQTPGPTASIRGWGGC